MIGPFQDLFRFEASLGLSFFLSGHPGRGLTPGPDAETERKKWLVKDKQERRTATGKKHF